MKKQINRRQFLKSTTALTAGLGTTSALGLASFGKKDSAFKTPCDEEFVSIFNGRNLDGWHINGASWKVENGAIVCEQDPPGSGNGGVLLTDKTYSDFELIMDVKPEWGCDSGVFLRSLHNGDSYQVYVDYHDEPNNGGISGFLYGQGTGAWRTEPFRHFGVFDAEGNLVDLEMRSFDLYPDLDENPDRYACTKEEWRSAWKLNDYNELRIRCEGKYPIITTWINGVMIGKFDAAANIHPRFDKERVYEQLGDEGHIGLQVHGGSTWWAEGKKVYWKNIRIRELL